MKSRSADQVERVCIAILPIVQKDNGTKKVEKQDRNEFQCKSHAIDFFK